MRRVATARSSVRGWRWMIEQALLDFLMRNANLLVQFLEAILDLLFDAELVHQVIPADRVGQLFDQLVRGLFGATAVMAILRFCLYASNFKLL